MPDALLNTSNEVAKQITIIIIIIWATESPIFLENAVNPDFITLLSEISIYNFYILKFIG